MSLHYPDPGMQQWPINIREVIAIDNPSALKFWAMGFVLHEVENIPNEDTDSIVVMGHFSCVCGKREYLAYRVSAEELASTRCDQVLNAYFFLERSGSMSREHLLNDGYAAAKVDEMLARGRDTELGESLACRAMGHMEIGNDFAKLRSDYPAREIYQEAIRPLVVIGAPR